MQLKINVHCHLVVMKQPVNFLVTANSGQGPDIVNNNIIISNL